MTHTNWREAQKLQWHLKKELREKLEKYFRFRVLKAAGKKNKQPYSIAQLRKLQTDINKLRLEAALPRIRYVQETLSNLKTRFIFEAGKK